MQELLSTNQFRKTGVQFLGQIIDGQGIKPDPAKVEAIQQFKQPTNVKEVRQFLGITNHLSKFMPNLAELPFGITSALECFQKKMSCILADLRGVVCMMDDVLVHGSTHKEHDERLKAVLN